MSSKKSMILKILTLLLASSMTFAAWSAMPVLAASQSAEASTSATLAKDGYTLVKKSSGQYLLTMEGMKRTEPLSLTKLPKGSTVEILLQGENSITVDEILGSEMSDWYDEEMTYARGIDADGMNLVFSGNGSLTVRTDGLKAGQAGTNIAINCETLTVNSGTLKVYTGYAQQESTAIRTGYEDTGRVTINGGTLEVRGGCDTPSGTYAAKSTCGLSTQSFTMTGGQLTIWSYGAQHSNYNFRTNDYKQTGGTVSLHQKNQQGGFYAYDAQLGGKAVLQIDRYMDNDISQVTVSDDARLEMQSGFHTNSVLVEDRGSLILTNASSVISCSYGEGITVTGGTMSVTTNLEGGYYGAIDMRDCEQIKVTGGTLKVESQGPMAMYGISNFGSFDPLTISVTGGTLSAKGPRGGIKIDGAIEVSGGNLTARGGDSSGYTTGIEGQNLRVQVSGGVLDAAGGVCNTWPEYPKGEAGAQDGYAYGSYGIRLGSERTATVNVTGGTLKAYSNGTGGGAGICAWSVGQSGGTISTDSIYQTSSNSYIDPNKLPAATETLPDTITGEESGYSWVYTLSSGKLHFIKRDGSGPSSQEIMERLEKMGYQVSSISVEFVEYRYPGYGEELPKTGTYSGDWAGFDWKYEAASQTLTIEGKGDMPSYFGEPTQLAQYVFGTRNLVIGEGVTSVPYYLITCLPELDSLKVGSTCKDFSYKQLEVQGTMTVDAGNQWFAVYDNCLYTKDLKKLLMLPEHKTSIQFPEQLEIISTESLSNLEMDAVVIPWGVTTLESRAFYYNSVATIVLPDTLTNMAEDALDLGRNIFTKFIYSRQNSCKAILDPKCQYTSVESVARYYNLPANSFWTVGGKTYYFDANSRMVTGAITIDGKLYCFSDGGVMQKDGWVKANDTWYYLKDGTPVTTGWTQVNGIWYYLSSDGKMKANCWIKDNGRWYWVSGSGARYTSCWGKINGKWYWFDEAGRMMENGWRMINGVWYYFYASGAMAENAWVKTGGRWYYCTGSGAMAKNAWIKSGNYWYYLGFDGGMLTNTTTPDGYRVDSEGRWR